MSSSRKIIHIDMDCFYAAIEERDHPELRGKPMAVGGSGSRSVLTTANYEARAFGCRSALPNYKALELCPHLIVMPVRMEVYREASAKIREVFRRFTDQIEPLSLDEAFLDVSEMDSEPWAVAWEIRSQIFEETQLTASAGISSNKMIAKIASDWKKPNGQFEVKEEEIAAFMKELPVAKLFGVGKKMQEKLRAMQVESCADLQAFTKIELAQRLGNWGVDLFNRCRGMDERAVKANRIRKSVSIERTFRENVQYLADLEPLLDALVPRLVEALKKHEGRVVRAVVVKLKFADFTHTTAEKAGAEVDGALFRELLSEAWSRGRNQEVRLLGAGVRFRDADPDDPQLSLL